MTWLLAVTLTLVAAVGGFFVGLFVGVIAQAVLSPGAYQNSVDWPELACAGVGAGIGFGWAVRGLIKERRES